MKRLKRPLLSGLAALCLLASSALADEPKIDGVRSAFAHNVESTILTWTTDVPTTGEVHYRGNEFNGPQAVTSQLGLWHMVKLPGILAGDQFLCTIRVRDVQGDLASTGAIRLESDGGGGPVGEVDGPPTVWVPLELTFTGPHAHERDDSPNPFLDFRLVLELRGPEGQHYFIPGFFNSDGQGGDEGDGWTARFALEQEGLWEYQVHFSVGKNVAIDTDLESGSELSIDSATGFLAVWPAPLDAQGLERWGRLEDVGLHYWKFRDGSYFLKGGVDSPENLLAYDGFDNTVDQPGGASTKTLPDGIHRYGAHASDFGSEGLGDDEDPVWASQTSGTDSRGFVGAVNYLHSVGVNSLYFLPMNAGGDGREVVPFVGYANNDFDKTHYDVSKLHQWDLAFRHAQRHGMLLHFVLGETEAENEQWLDNGQLGVQRKLFYRELIARFGYYLALQWNLCEESDFTQSQVEEFADYIRAWDPYDHPVLFHTKGLPKSGNYAKYDAILGDPRFSAASLQVDPDAAGAIVEKWRAKSAAAGNPWILGVDEVAPADTGLTNWNAEELRKETLYDVYFSGGQIEWYFGYHDLPLGGDLRVENFRTREEMFAYMRFARELLEQNTPFWIMEPADELVFGESTNYGGAEVFALRGNTYAIYFPRASVTGELDLRNVQGAFQGRWYDPERGAFLGPPVPYAAGGWVTIGPPPQLSRPASEDWVLLLTR